MAVIPPPPHSADLLPDWLASFTNWEKQLPLEKGRREWGPLRCRKLLDRANLETSHLKVIQVAGSKGKGSTVMWMEALLKLRGLSVAAKTSPHLVSLEERIRVNGQPVEIDKLLEHLHRLYPALKAGQSEGDPLPTFFDLWTALFISIAVSRECSTILLEVGLGGPLDSTTAVPHDIGVLTTVDLEHRALLGDTLEEIAAEKSRIATRGKPFVIAPGETQEISRQTALSLEAIPMIVEVDDRVPKEIPSTQRLNASTALRALESASEFAPWSQQEVEDAARIVSLPGRLEIIQGTPSLLLDGAHTPASIRAFVEAFSKFRGAHQRGAILLGMLRDKDPIETLSELTLLDPIPYLCTVSIPVSRGMTADELATAITPLIESLTKDTPSRSINVALSAEKGMEWLKQMAATGEPIAATGSMYLAGLIRQHWDMPDEPNPNRTQSSIQGS
ncbi:MAG: hypothetical protein CBC13_08735 [Planctomycetia bacterium TMED53]|nr:MAG: hypothetical protein CBC13_08735 [Planctomycetia bacterium TMED53]